MQEKRSGKNTTRNGFTLIEIMVVVTVTAFLAGIILLYTSSSRAQIALFTEKVKIAQVVLRAKSLAISTYNDVSTPCGYGLYVDPAARAYSLIRYTVNDCNNLSTIDARPESRPPVPNEQYTLPPELMFGATSSLRYIIFVPPDPRVLLGSGNGSLLPQPSGDIVVQSLNGNFKATISVNTAGQVTF